MIGKEFISIIIPVYNEGKNIATAINKSEKIFINPHEYIVVYDFDDDDTIPYILKLKKKKVPIKHIKNLYKHGVTNAVRTGIKHAQGSIIVVMTPDESDDPRTVNKMFNKMKEGYDVVCATRYTKGGKRLDQTSFKLFLSYIIGISTPFLLGIPTTDITNGFKMYRKKVVNNVKLTSDGWEFAMEMVIKAHKKGYKISEVPTVSRPRPYGASKFKFFQWLPFYIKWLFFGISYRITKSGN